MAGPVREPDDDRGNGETPPGMPRWVKISGLVVLALIVALVVIMLVIGGEHGPGLHTGAADRSGMVTSIARGGTLAL